MVKIWVLEQIYDEFSIIRGVFSSEEKAIASRDRIIREEKHDWLSINEFDLDKFIEFGDSQ